MDMCTLKDLLGRLPNLVSVQISPKIMMIWTGVLDRNICDFRFRMLCTEEEEGRIRCSTYHSSLPCPSSTVGSIEDALRVLDEFTKLRLCEGVVEEELENFVNMSCVVICKYNNQYLYRSRSCQLTVKESEACPACRKLSKNKKVKEKEDPTLTRDEASLKLKHCCPSENCSRSFSSHVALSKHVRQEHVDLYKCTWENCDKHFGSQRTLDTHVKRHLADFSQFCADCGKGFVTLKELKLHKVCHRKEKDHECKVCDRKFRRKLHLNNHMNMHTGSKNYLCNQCGASFSRLGNLKDHRHRQHGGERRYPCDLCDKKFHAQQLLNRHKRVHTGEKPYLCLVCEKRFSRDHHLRKHVKQVHGVNQEAVVHYDIPSPSQTLVIHTSSLPENTETEENIESTLAPTLFYHEGDPDLVHVDIQEHITLIRLDS